jgi:hypothetical protein
MSDPLQVMIFRMSVPDPQGVKGDGEREKSPIEISPRYTEINYIQWFGKGFSGGKIFIVQMET